MSGWMKSLRQRPTLLQEPLLQRPDLATLACVTAACQLLRHPGAHHLVIRTVYGQDRIRLVRWPQGLAYGQGKNHDKGRGIAWDEVRALYGKARLQPVLTLLGSKQINPRAVERHKGTSHLRHQRKGW
jgi:hypothetical protein